MCDENTLTNCFLLHTNLSKLAQIIKLLMVGWGVAVEESKEGPKINTNPF